MKFKKTLWTRAILHAVLAISGIFTGVYAIKTDSEQTIMYFGFALAFASVLLFSRVIRLMRCPEQMKVREVAEKDERNINIMQKAKSLSLSICMIIATIATICFMVMGKIYIASVIAWCVIVYELIYLISYFVIAKRM